jgi:hypothetical protein
LAIENFKKGLYSFFWEKVSPNGEIRHTKKKKKAASVNI